MSTNPLLTNRVRLPGTTFVLPSKGLFYVNGELSPDVTDGEVHVYPLTSIDEIELKTPDLLFSGKAVDNVFKRCIPQILKPMDLTTTDVDYLLVCLRLVSYGPDIEVKHKHKCAPDKCAEPKDHTYHGSVEAFVQQARIMSERDFGQEYVLDHSSGVKVNITPLRYGDFIKYMTEIQVAVENVTKDVNPKEELTRECNRLSANISNVTNDSLNVVDKTHISEWLQTLTVKEIKEITDKFSNQTEWGCDTRLRVVCSDCGEEIEIPITINPIDFFTWS